MSIYTQLNPRHRETQRDTERDTERHRERDTERDRERHRERQRDRKREREHPFLSYSSKKSKFHQQMSIYTQLNPISL